MKNIWNFVVLAIIMSCSSNKQNGVVTARDSLIVSETEIANHLYKHVKMPPINVSDSK